MANSFLQNILKGQPSSTPEYMKERQGNRSYIAPKYLISGASGESDFTPLAKALWDNTPTDGFQPVVAGLQAIGTGDMGNIGEYVASAPAPARLGPAAPTPMQSQQMGPSTAKSDFDLAWQGRDSYLRSGQATPFTPNQEGIDRRAALDAQAREAARGGSGRTGGILDDVLPMPSGLVANVAGQMGERFDERFMQPTAQDTVANMLGSGGSLPSIPTSPVGTAKPDASLFANPQELQSVSSGIGQVGGGGNPFKTATQAHFDPFSESAQGYNPMTAPEAGIAQIQKPANGLTTLSGAPLSEFLSGQAMPEAGFARAENAMYGDKSLSRGLSGDAATKAFQDASAAREARIGQSGQTVSDAERRGERSFSDYVDLAGGDRKKARQYQVRERAGLDMMTGAKPAEAGGMTETERLNREKFEWEKAQDVADWVDATEKTRTKRTDAMNTEIGALGTIIDQAENVSGVTKEAQRKVGVNTAGFFHPLKWVGGTEAASLAGNLETIKSDAFVANITEMRQNSPTGGAVGNVSDKDLEMLQSLQTSFRQNLPPKDLRKNLSEYRRIRNKVANDAKKGFVRKYGQENFDTHFGDNATGLGGQMGDSMESGSITPSGRKVKIY